MADFAFPSYVFSMNSGADGNTRSSLRCKFGKPLRLEGGRKHFLKLVASKQPITMYNVTAALGNNTIRYTVDNTAQPVAWKVLTFQDGVYTSVNSGAASLNTKLDSLLLEKKDFELDINNGNQPRYAFALSADPSVSKGSIILNTAYTDYAKYSIDLSNGGTSTFYKLMGFAANQTTLVGGQATTLVSTNNINIWSGQFRIMCDLVETFVDGRTEPQLCMDYYTGTANGYFMLPNSIRKDIVVPIRDDIVEIKSVKVDIIDRNGVGVVFGDNSTDADVNLEFYIY